VEIRDDDLGLAVAHAYRNTTRRRHASRRQLLSRSIGIHPDDEAVSEARDEESPGAIEREVVEPG
jgi:hypothetical protein